MIMLAAAAPLVKLAPDTTPEQQSGVRDIDQALRGPNKMKLRHGVRGP
jgi:hypothetical protein